MLVLISTLPQGGVPYLRHKQLQVLAFFNLLFFKTNEKNNILL